jgi:hypothetical protein
MLFETAMPGDVMGQGASANQQLNNMNQALPPANNFLPPAFLPPTRPVAQSAPSATRPVVITQFANSPGQQLPFGQAASAPLILNSGASAGSPNFSSFPPASAPPQRPVASSLSPFVAPIVNGITSGVTNSVLGAVPFTNILRNNAPAPAAQQFASNPPAQTPARAPVLLSNPPAAATTAVTKTATARPTRTMDISESELFDSDYISLSDAGASIRASLKTIFVGAGIGIMFLAVF